MSKNRKSFNNRPTKIVKKVVQVAQPQIKRKRGRPKKSKEYSL